MIEGLDQTSDNG